MCCTVASCCWGRMNLQTGSKAIAIYKIVYAIVTMIGFAALALSGFSRFSWWAALIQLEIAIVSGILLYGANARKSAVVIVWLVLEMMNLIGLLSLAAASIGFASYGSYNGSENTYGFWILGVVLIIYCIVGSYLWTVVYSFNKELQSDNPAGLEMRKGMKV